MRSGYKQTPIGEIPEEWKVIRIKEVAKTTSGGTPSRNIKQYYNGTIPWVKSGELDDNVIKETEEKITDAGLENSSAKMLPKGALLVALYGATVGKTAILNINATTNQAICAILPKNMELDLHFLQYWLIFRRNHLVSISSGGAQPNISQDIIRSLKIPLPPMEEQRRIAQVLSTVDDAIQKADEAIVRTERLKKGLMHKLSTEGIGHKEFKETKIGKIPKTWKVVTLKNITTKIKDIDHKMPEKLERGIPFVSIKYMLKFPDHDFKIDFDDPDLEFISQEDYEHHRKRFNAEEKDIIYSRFGTIGNAKLINTKQSLIASYSIVLIKPDRDEVDASFLVYALNSGKVRIQARIATKGATNRNLHLEDIQNLKIPLPPVREQQKIAGILSTVDYKLELDRKRKGKLECIKKGLMNVLLTGKRRVKVAM